MYGFILFWLLFKQISLGQYSTVTNLRSIIISLLPNRHVFGFSEFIFEVYSANPQSGNWKTASPMFYHGRSTFFLLEVFKLFLSTGNVLAKWTSKAEGRATRGSNFVRLYQGGFALARRYDFLSPRSSTPIFISFSRSHRFVENQTKQCH